MPPTSVPELQQKLYKRMGLAAPEQIPDRKPNRRGPSQPPSRREQRKAHRVQKKTNRYAKQPAPSRPVQSQSRPSTSHNQKSQLQESKKPRPVQKLSPADIDGAEEFSGLDDDDEDDYDFGKEDLGIDDDEDDFGNDDSNGSLENAGNRGTKGAGDHNDMSKAEREKLAQDDAEIEELERKLGIKKGRKSLPQSFKDDGLDELMGDEAADATESEDEGRKRKVDYDDWLSSKRRKTNMQTTSRPNSHAESEMNGSEAGESESSGDENGDESSNEGFDDESFDEFDSFSKDDASTQPRQRENPYVAPTASSGAAVAKYVPPSLRKGAGTEDESKTRLRKQVQGLINRLTDANILSIVQSADELYQKNARGVVTEIFTDVILAQVCKPESLPDQFFVLTGGFAAALYKVTGSSFGSHLVRRVVKDFGDEYEAASKNCAGVRKETSNLITLLTQLYVFEVVSCKIIFDYMERLLSDLTELNVELLLRICRMAGRLLRRDDPLTLKHVSRVLNASVAKIGYANVSVRSKFMIETINDLKNSKPKARGMDSVVVSEHVMRMKKRLGELKSQSRRLDGLAPMGMGVDDIEGADTQGKWWLVGASVPVKADKPSRGSDKTAGGSGDGLTDDEDMDMVLPDYPKKARAQGLGTTVQIGIFTALLSAMDYEHGYRQFLDMRLKKDDQVDIARVLVQCVGSEAHYNEYYALVAIQACSNSRIRFALQDRLWKILRGLGESLFGEEAEDEETAESERMKDERRMSNVSRFYAQLVADGALAITILKPLDLPEVSSWTSTFVEWIMVSLLRECKGKRSTEDAKIERVFGPARDLPTLAAGMHWFLRKRVRKTKLIGAKEAKKLERLREKAQVALQSVAES